MFKREVWEGEQIKGAADTLHSIMQFLEDTFNLSLSESHSPDLKLNS